MVHGDQLAAAKPCSRKKLKSFVPAPASTGSTSAPATPAKGKAKTAKSPAPAGADGPESASTPSARTPGKRPSRGAGAGKGEALVTPTKRGHVEVEADDMMDFTPKPAKRKTKFKTETRQDTPEAAILEHPILPAVYPAADDFADDEGEAGFNISDLVDFDA